MNRSFPITLSVCHIPLSKTRTVTSFFLEWSNSRQLQNVGSNTENHKGFFVSHTALSQFLRSLKKLLRLRRAVGQSDELRWR